MSREYQILLAATAELAPVTTLEGLREAIGGALRRLLPGRHVSVLRAAHGMWEAVVGPEDAPDRVADYVWRPLIADGKTIGMLGLRGWENGESAELLQAVVTTLASTAQTVLTIDRLKQDIVRDGLTGCFNRAHAIEVLEGNLRRANRTGFPVSILMIDIDDFKQVNDRFGHVPGDVVLATVAGQLHGMLRQSDIRCRLGGDEFLVILPDTPIEDARRVAESIRSSIEQLVIPTVRGTLKVTASIGVAAAACGSTIDVPGFIDRADVALYRAKQAGRNCVQTCTTSPSRVRPWPRQRRVSRNGSKAGPALQLAPRTA